MNMREIRILLRTLAETGQGLPNHEFRAQINAIIKATEEIEEQAETDLLADQMAEARRG